MSRRGVAGLGMWIGAAALSTLGIAGATASCSLIVDTNADACAADVDCKTAGQVCDKAANVPHVCVAKVCMAGETCPAGSTCTSGACAPSGNSECKVNKDCAFKGEHYICRKDTLKCVSLASTACTNIHGDDSNDDAFIIGSILPTTGADVSAGKPLEEAIIVALDEFKQNVNGLPPAPGATNRRPYVLVGCDDASDDATGIAAAKHLSEDIGVPAIIGAAFSGTTIQLATTVTIPDKVLLFSPSATSAAITNLDDKGLVWRTAPSDNLQAQALALYVPKVEAAIKAQNPMIAQVKVAILNKGDAYGSGLAKTLEGQLKFNGASATDPANSSNYKRIDYGNPDDPMSDMPQYGQTVSTMLAFQPNIVLIFGGNEGITDIFEKIEEQWPVGNMDRPYYVFSDGGEVDPLWNYTKMTDALRKRISGSAPGAVAGDKLFQAFHSSFLAKFPNDSPDVFGAAGAYDITYLLAYAAVGIGAQPVNGTNLSNELTKMSSGPEVDVGTDISTAFTKISAGGIDFLGASGPLNFDPKTGEAPSDIQIWCLPSNGMGKASSATNSGLYFDAKSAALAGAIGAICN